MKTDLSNIKSDVIRDAMIDIFNGSIRYEMNSPIDEECCEGKPSASRLIDTVKHLDNLLTVGTDDEYGDADEGIIDQAISDVIDCIIGIQIARKNQEKEKQVIKNGKCTK